MEPPPPPPPPPPIALSYKGRDGSCFMHIETLQGYVKEHISENICVLCSPVKTLSLLKTWTRSFGNEMVKAVDAGI